MSYCVCCVLLGSAIVVDAGGCGDLWVCRCFGCVVLLLSLSYGAGVSFGGFGLEVVCFCVSFSVFVAC